MSTALTLPQLSANVPVRLLPSLGRAERCAITALLLDAGVIGTTSIAAHWQPGTNDELDIAHGALERWLQRAVPRWHCLHPYFCIASMVAGEAPAQGCSDTRPVTRVRLSWGEAYVAQWTVGPALEKLEAAVPRLGATVLELLEQQDVYPLFTPLRALEQASELYWYGEDDETVALEEYAGQCGAQEIAAIRADMVTKADIDAAYPAWATEWGRKRLSQRLLASTAASYADPAIRRIASLALRLSRLAVRNAYLPQCEGTSLGFGAVLCWRDADITVRLSDAMARYAWEGDSESCSDIGEVTLDIKDVGGMRHWLHSMQQQLQVIGLVDNLLDALAARE